MLYGYHGKILHVDLSNSKLSIEYPGEDFYRMYIGGSAIGTYYLLKLTTPGIDPLSSENVLILSLSVLTGAPISGLSRMTATAKSPMSGLIGCSECGGYFPAELKFSGYDAVVIHGKSKSPVYLYIHDGETALRSAEHLWGRCTADVEYMISSELKDGKIQVAQCGPAAEKGVRFSAIINNSNRANGRTGMGAVMASKYLKAVVVRGNQRPLLYDRASLLKLAKWGTNQIGESSVSSLSKLGTSGITLSQSQAGGLPSYNWESGYFENAQSLDGRTMKKTILKERDSCYSCSIRCKRVVEVSEGPYWVDPVYGGPEYETIGAFGSYCGIDDLKVVSHANQLCNMYGMDTITCGSTIAWAMNCFEHGILSKSDTGGIELQFGNAEAMIKVVEQIGKREGFGDLLGEGSSRAAKVIGKGSEDLVVAVKNQELPAHMPQVKRSLGLIYAVNPFGADHQSSEHDPCYMNYPERMREIGLIHPQPERMMNEEKVRFALTTQYAYSCLDTMDVCQFVFGPGWQLYNMSQLADVVYYITGWKLSVGDMLKIGERRLNLLRAFNAREGIGRDEDTLPKKLKKALVGGESAGLMITDGELEQSKNRYYLLAGWNVDTGIPTREKLTELGLGWIGTF